MPGKTFSEMIEEKGFRKKDRPVRITTPFYTFGGIDTASIFVNGGHGSDPIIPPLACNPAQLVISLHSPTSTETVSRRIRG